MADSDIIVSLHLVIPFISMNNNQSFAHGIKKTIVQSKSKLKTEEFLVPQ
jgi:hypothetical protein